MCLETQVQPGRLVCQGVLEPLDLEVRLEQLDQQDPLVAQVHLVLPDPLVALVPLVVLVPLGHLDRKALVEALVAVVLPEL